ncbi:MAG TPA: YihY/virulence factor BrkB family protein [Armatimonadota bacterium]|jgi:membrane protein
MAKVPAPASAAADSKHAHPSELRSWVARVRNVATRFIADRGPVMAAALSFFVLLSIVPVLLLVIWMLSVAFHGDAARAVDELQKLIAHTLPGASVQRAYAQIAQQIDLAGYIQGIFRRGAAAGIVGLLTLIWAAMQVFVNASDTLNAAFEVRETRSWGRLRLVALGVLAGSSVLLVLSVLAASGPDVARRTLPALGIPNPAPWPVDVVFLVLAFALNVCLFGIIYRFLPAARIAWRDAFVGGAFMSVAWLAVTKLFAMYLANENKMYGALGGIILLITWIYYTNMLVLLGAEVTALAGKIRRGVAAPDEATLRRNELDAVFHGRAEPLRQPAPDPRERAREDVAAIREHARAAAAAVRSAAHGVRTAPERNRAGRKGV